jgi:hypothetical protein
MPVAWYHDAESGPGRDTRRSCGAAVPIDEEIEGSAAPPKARAVKSDDLRAPADPDGTGKSLPLLVRSVRPIGGPLCGIVAAPVPAGLHDRERGYLDPTLTASWWRPFFRRRARTFRPDLVAIRARKPCLFRRLRFRGRYVGFMVSCPDSVQRFDGG